MAQHDADAPAAQPQPGYTIRKRARNWLVIDKGELVCITLYKRGAEEVVRRLET